MSSFKLYQLYILVNHTRLYLINFKTILSSETSIIPHDPPYWLKLRSVSVYLTRFRNTRFRSVTLRKSISWNLAPEEKINFIPPWHIPPQTPPTSRKRDSRHWCAIFYFKKFAPHIEDRYASVYVWQSESELKSVSKNCTNKLQNFPSLEKWWMVKVDI